MTEELNPFIPCRRYFADGTNVLCKTQDALDEAEAKGGADTPAAHGFIESPHVYAPGDEPPKGAQIDPITGRVVKAKKAKD